MRILVLVDCYLPSPKSCAKLIHDLALEMVSAGHEVVLLTPVEEGEHPLCIEAQGRLIIARVPIGKIKGAPLPVRALREMAMPHVLGREADGLIREKRIDLVVYYSPSIFFAPLVKRVKGIWGCPAYLILRDIFPKWARDCGVLNDGVVHAFFQAEAIRHYDEADVIGVESQGNLDYFAKEYPEKDYRVEVLNNWTRLDEGAIQAFGIRKKFGLGEKVVFFYGGNMGVAQGMDDVLHLMRALRNDPRAAFLLVGEGCEVARIKRVIAEEALTHVRLHPSVDQHTYLSMLSEADVGLVSLSRNLETHNVPSKALPYMYFSLPILATLNPGNELQNVVNDWGAGICVESGNVKGMIDGARRLIDSREIRRAMGARARQLLEARFSAGAAARQVAAAAAPSRCAQRSRTKFDIVFDFSASPQGGGLKRSLAYAEIFAARGLKVCFLAHPQVAASLRERSNAVAVLPRPALARLFRDQCHLASMRGRTRWFFSYGIPIYEPIGEFNWLHLSNALPFGLFDVPLSPKVFAKNFLLRRRFIRHADVPTVVSGESQFTVDLYRRLTAASGRHVVLPNGVSAFEKLPEVPRRPWAVTAGTSRYKNLIQACEVFERCRDRLALERFVIVGDPTEVPRAVRRKPYVQLMDRVPRDEMLRILRESRLYISASQIENSSNAVAEALWLCEEVAVSDIPSHRELVPADHESVAVGGARFLLVKGGGKDLASLSWAEVVDSMLEIMASSETTGEGRRRSASTAGMGLG